MDKNENWIGIFKQDPGMPQRWYLELTRSESEAESDNPLGVTVGYISEFSRSWGCYSKADRYDFTQEDGPDTRAHAADMLVYHCEQFFGKIEVRHWIGCRRERVSFLD